uniref:Protein translocase subunit SecD n=2 Tax=uncultured Chloroflexota bacterium TaxID=166587 RepID=H5SBB4_9CHLR|nr:preprotein translocase subunit SecD [uncultured Chloroflexota bacterium]
MRRQNLWLFLIIVLVVVALVVDFSQVIQIPNPLNAGAMLIYREVPIRLGLDLRGGLQAVLQADMDCAKVNPSDLQVTRQILERRANALGVSEITMQIAGNCRIVAEFPGVDNPDQVVATLQQTGRLEFVEMGNEPVPEGTLIQTDYGQQGSSSPGNDGAKVTPPAEMTPSAASTATPIPPETPSATPVAAGTPSAPEPAAQAKVYHTVLTGAALEPARILVRQDQVGKFVIEFALKPDAKQLFADYTSTHIGQVLAIVLDGRVISTPVIQSAITDGAGVITGNFTEESANALAIQLRYGALPIPVKIVQTQTIGPTLGEESVRKSVVAGVIGIVTVILFMGLYYRLPGLLADLALIIYALLSLMLFKLIPVVLTLPGIAGFILSIGMAVDANVLIFERLKEELRAGRTLRQAIDLGWNRAWPSIRDSNISTLITCAILFTFGSTFGASIVKGFSVTLALGVLVSLFTAILVTRLFLHLVLDNIKLAEHPRWFGL